MRPVYKETFKPFIGEKKLNIGCGGTFEDGWINMDFNPQFPEVVKHDLRVFPWPFERGSMDTVLASHVLEHFRDEQLFNVVAEAGAVLKVGGHLIGVVPYATHSDGYANPFHKQLWDHTTPMQFDKKLYERKGTAGTGSHQFMPLIDWSVVHIELTPDQNWMGTSTEDLNVAMRSHLNVIQEMQFVLRRES